MRIRRIAATVIGVAIMFAGFFQPTAFASDDFPVAVQIDSVSQNWLTLDSDETLTLTGSITNTSNAPISWVTVEFWRSFSRLTSPADLVQAQSQPALTPAGARLRTGPNLMRITSEDAFAPGATATFKVSATLKELGFSRQGAYRVGVHVRALAADGIVRTVGVNRWVTSVVGESQDHVAVAVLTAAPTMPKLGAFSSNELVTDLERRLKPLLAFAQQPGVTSVIDPALYDAVAQLAKKHTVQGHPKPPSEVAVAWLAEVNKLATNGRTFRLPYGNPDVAASQKAGQLQDLIADTALALGTDHPLNKLNLALFGTGEMTEALLADLDALKPAFVLAKNVSRSFGIVSKVTPFTETGLPPGPPNADIVTSTNLAQEVVAKTNHEQVIRVVSSLTDLAHETISPPWRVRTDRSVPKPGSVSWAKPKETASDSALDATLGRVFKLRASLSELESLDAAQAAARVSALGRSADFSPAQAKRFVADAGLVTLPSKIASIHAQPSFVMSGQENVFPLSVTNHTNVPITVSLNIKSEIPLRIKASAPQLIKLDPKETISTSITLTASGRARVGLSGSLETTSGRVLDAPLRIDVTSTQASGIGWVMIVASGLFVIVGTVLRIRKSRLEEAQLKRDE